MTAISFAIFVLISIGVLFKQASPQDECNTNVIGKHFIIGFTENYGAIQFEDTELHLLLVSFNPHVTQVKISSRFILNDNTLFAKIVELQPGGHELVIVPTELELIGTEKSLKSVEIESDFGISVYAIHLEPYTTDGYLAIPVENLGTQYVISSHERGGWSTLFAVFGTRDDTTVTILLNAQVTYDGITYSAGDTLILKLNRLETIQVLAIPNENLAGSIVSSNHPISVINGNQCANTPGSACDTIIEQSIPVNSWGTKHFYSNPPNEQDSSLFVMVAFFDDTKFTVDGSDITLGSGGVWQEYLSGSGIITTSQPALLTQVLHRVDGSIVDPSLIQVPTENQFTPFLGFTTPTHSAANINGFVNFVNIILKSDVRDLIRLNEQEITSSSILPSLRSETDIDNSDYVLLIVELPREEALYYITQETDPNNSPMSAIAYGFERDESYGYAGGLSLPSNQRLLTINPFYIRLLGGERLFIDLPCDISQSIGDTSFLKCKFGSMTVQGEYYVNQVTCVTPPLMKPGFITLYVSVDGGSTFPFSGGLYVADEDSIQPLITIHNQGDYQLDFTSNSMTTLTWDPQLFGDASMSLRLELLMVTDPFALTLEWGVRNTLMEGVSNTGSLSVILRDIVPTRSRRDVFTIARTIGTLILLPPPLLLVRFAYITARFLIVATGAILSTTCADFEDILKKTPQGLGPCPCRTSAARSDSNFEEDNLLIGFFHPNSTSCYRSRTPSPSGSGQQCCYTSDGEINLKIGAGTPDTYHPEIDVLEHFRYDVLPFLYCCKLSDNCNSYFKYRQPDDCSKYPIPPRTRTSGDPHFTTLDGLQYTFNGAGEFTVASSLLLNFTFQARMEKYRNTSSSVYTAFVVQTHNSSRIQLQRNIINQTLIIVDDLSIQLTEGVIPEIIAAGVTLQIEDDLSQIHVIFSTGVSLRVFKFPESMSFLLQLTDSFRGNMRGLLGNLNGDTSDDFMSPDGQTIPIDSSLSQIHYDFGLNWMITQNESLFSYQSPFDYNTYSQPSFVPSFISPNISEVSQEIRDLCGESLPCLFDAITTGMLSFANETLTFTKIVEEILNNSVATVSCGFPSDVENAVLNGSTFFAGNTISVNCISGYQVVGHTVPYCSEDGVWSGNFTCVKTVVSCGYPDGLFLPGNQSQLTFNPSKIRVLGGEILIVYCKACIINQIISSLIKCKFGLIIVQGELTGDYIICITPPLFEIGFLTVYLSVDGGNIFPYNGLVYVAHEAYVPPLISMNNQGISLLDFTSNSVVTLTWNPQIFGDINVILQLKLLIIIDPFALNPVWKVSHVLVKVVINSGTLSINLQYAAFTICDNKFVFLYKRTIGTLILTRSYSVQIIQQTYISVGILTINTFAAIRQTTCADFKGILKVQPQGLLPCPCTASVAAADDNFIEEDNQFIGYFHPGSTICYISRTASYSGSGQQCCYASDGRINLKQNGAGTADTYHPRFHPLKHLLFDVLPWLYCCKLSANCDCYLKYRPVDDCSDYPKPARGPTSGDPHFTTLDGLQYTFNGAGEFTISSSIRHSFIFQARMERYRNTSSSVYTAFVVQTQYSSRIQLQRNINNKDYIFIDDVSFQLTEGVMLETLAIGATLRIENDLSQVSVHFSVGISLRIYLYTGSMSFLLQLDESFRWNVRGLLGNFNGDTTDDLMSPDGHYIPIDSSLSQIHYQFGLNWMITRNESLFCYQSPFNYTTYSKPLFVPSFFDSNVTSVSQEIRDLCGDSFPCLFDAVTTGMLSFANETLTFSNMVEDLTNSSVEVISCGYPTGIENAVLSSLDFFSGSILIISCIPGYQLTGPDVIYCGYNGVWSATFTCLLCPP